MLSGGATAQEGPMQIEELAIEAIKPYENNPRDNDPGVDAVAKSIEEFGWNVPIVVDEQMTVVAGHTRLKAAAKLGKTTVRDGALKLLAV
jgi:ParB-like chromosome segregation protein Spo0J